MKELRIKSGLVNGQKPTEEEKETLRGTMTVLARVIDESIYRSVMKSGLDKDLYLSSLERIWYSYEEGAKLLFTDKKNIDEGNRK